MANRNKKLKEWRKKFKKMLIEELRKEGFADNEIRQIVIDSLAGLLGKTSGLRGIVRNLGRLFKAQRAIKRVYKRLGPKPLNSIGQKEKQLNKREKIRKKIRNSKRAKKCGARCKDFKKYGFCDRLVYDPPCWQHR